MAQFLDYGWDSDEDFEESSRQGTYSWAVIFVNSGNSLLLQESTLLLYVLLISLYKGGVRDVVGRGGGGLQGGRGVGRGDRGGGRFQGGRGVGQGGRGGGGSQAGQGGRGVSVTRGGGESFAGTPVHHGHSQVAGPSVRRGRVGGEAGRGAGQVLPVGRADGQTVAAAVGGGGVAGEEHGRGGLQGVGRGGGQPAGRGRGRGERGGRGRGVKARSWVFTINNYRDFPKELPRGPPPVKYLCFGKEVSQNGTPHLQGYVSFKNAVYRPSRFFEQYGNGHFEMARGSADQNAEYCAKEGDFTEFGTRPQSRADQGHHGRRGGELETERWEEAWRSAKQGKIEEIPADIRMRHYSTIVKVAAKYQKAPASLPKLDNTWIVGPPGTGKSTYVHMKYPGAYKKGFSKWWCNYQEDDEGHRTVLLDDLHPKWSEKEHLKNWADLFPFVAEYKGGSMQIRPERIVVTSNYTIEQVPLVPVLQI